MRPLLQAEQAVLGAVLLDPGQLDQLGWLEPAHFYRPAHAALFAALRRRRARGLPELAADGTVPLDWVSGAVAEAGHHVQGLASAYAHRLVSACPRPGHAPVYGRMVLEGAIHRTVTEHAVRLHQIARADAVRGEVTTTLHHADVLAAVLDDLARCWGTQPRPAEPAPILPASTDAADAQTVADTERLLLATLVERPPGIGEVARWLRPEDFAVPVHGQLYRCLAALHHRGEPVDRLTLLWEAQQRGLLADGTTSGEQISAICEGVGPGSAEYLGEQVLASALLRTASACARTIRDLAGADALAPGLLINQALAALLVLDDIRSRWTACSHPPTPPPGRGEPANEPPSTRIRAARARSTPPAAAPSPPAAGTAIPPVRPALRSRP